MYTNLCYNGVPSNLRSFSPDVQNWHNHIYRHTNVVSYSDPKHVQEISVVTTLVHNRYFCACFVAFVSYLHVSVFQERYNPVFGGQNTSRNYLNVLLCSHGVCNHM